MEITFDTDVNAGNTVVYYHVEMDLPDSFLEAILWRCTVCRRQGGGKFYWDATPSRYLGWASLGAPCCGKRCLVLAAWGLYRGRPTSAVWSSGRLRLEVPHEARVETEESYDVFTWLEANGFASALKLGQSLGSPGP